MKNILIGIFLFICIQSSAQKQDTSKKYCVSLTYEQWRNIIFSIDTIDAKNSAILLKLEHEIIKQVDPQHTIDVNSESIKKAKNKK
jgi:hypothetical protein